MFSNAIVVFNALNRFTNSIDKDSPARNKYFRLLILSIPSFSIVSIKKENIDGTKLTCVTLFFSIQDKILLGSFSNPDGNKVKEPPA